MLAWRVPLSALFAGSVIFISIDELGDLSPFIFIRMA